LDGADGNGDADAVNHVVTGGEGFHLDGFVIRNGNAAGEQSARVHPVLGSEISTVGASNARSTS
jgi:hypothetical protein